MKKALIFFITSLIALPNPLFGQEEEEFEEVIAPNQEHIEYNLEGTTNLKLETSSRLLKILRKH